MTKSRRMRWVGHVVCTEEMRNAYKILIGRLERKRSFRRRSHRWEDDIKMGPSERGWRVWIAFIWLRIGTGGRL
jgi:hypothetical protein